MLSSPSSSDIGSPVPPHVTTAKAPGRKVCIRGLVKNDKAAALGTPGYDTPVSFGPWLERFKPFKF